MINISKGLCPATQFYIFTYATTRDADRKIYHMIIEKKKYSTYKTHYLNTRKSKLPKHNNNAKKKITS